MGATQREQILSSLDRVGQVRAPLFVYKRMVRGALETLNWRRGDCSSLGLTLPGFSSEKAARRFSQLRIDMRSTESNEQTSTWPDHFHAQCARLTQSRRHSESAVGTTCRWPWAMLAQLTGPELLEPGARRADPFELQGSERNQVLDYHRADGPMSPQLLPETTEGEQGTDRCEADLTVA